MCALGVPATRKTMRRTSRKIGCMRPHAAAPVSGAIPGSPIQQKTTGEKIHRWFFSILFCRGVKPAARRGGQNLAVCGTAFEQRAQQVSAGGCGLYLAPLAATKAYRLALSWRAAGVGASRSNPQYSSVALPRRTTARGEARVLS